MLSDQVDSQVPERTDESGKDDENETNNTSKVRHSEFIKSDDALSGVRNEKNKLSQSS